jgi:hypothetical protein
MAIEAQTQKMANRCRGKVPKSKDTVHAWYALSTTDSNAEIIAILTLRCIQHVEREGVVSVFSVSLLLIQAIPFTLCTTFEMRLSGNGFDRILCVFTIASIDWFGFFYY